MNTIDKYSNVLERAIHSNVLTNEDIKKTNLYSEYWLVCQELSNLIVRYRYGFTELARTLCNLDYEDIVSEFTIILTRKFEAQVRAILNPRVDKYGNVIKHSHMAYVSSIFTRYILDILKMYEVRPIKEEKTDTPKKYWSNTSSSSPISDEDDSITILDFLSGKTDIPGEELLIRDAMQDSLMIVSKKNKSNRLTMLALLYDLEEEYLGINDDVRNKIYNSAKYSSIVDFYNNEVTRITTSLHLTPDPTFFAHNEKEFLLGKELTLSEIKVAYSRAKYDVKTSLAESFHITWEKQHRRKNGD